MHPGRFETPCEFDETDLFNQINGAISIPKDLTDVF